MQFLCFLLIYLFIWSLSTRTIVFAMLISTSLSCLTWIIPTITATQTVTTAKRIHTDKNIRRIIKQCGRHVTRCLWLVGVEQRGTLWCLETSIHLFFKKSIFNEIISNRNPIWFDCIFYFIWFHGFRLKDTELFNSIISNCNLFQLIVSDLIWWSAKFNTNSFLIDFNIYLNWLYYYWQKDTELFNSIISNCNWFQLIVSDLIWLSIDSNTYLFK